MTDEELKAFLSEYTKVYNYKNDSEKELMLRYMKALIVQFDTPGKITKQKLKLRWTTLLVSG